MRETQTISILRCMIDERHVHMHLVSTLLNESMGYDEIWAICKCFKTDCTWIVNGDSIHRYNLNVNSRYTQYVILPNLCIVIAKSINCYFAGINSCRPRTPSTSIIYLIKKTGCDQFDGIDSKHQLQISLIE